MTAITHQRYINRVLIQELAEKLYDLKSEDGKKGLFLSYVNHIADDYSYKKQEEWIEILNRQIIKK